MAIPSLFAVDNGQRSRAFTHFTVKKGTTMTHTTKLRPNSRPRVLSPNLLMMVVLLTITCAGQAGAQAAKYTMQRPSTAENISARMIENTESDSGHPAFGTVRVRPIEDFINAQGTPPPKGDPLFYAGPDAPFLPNYAVGFTTANCPGEFCQYPASRIAVVDYAGGANQYLIRHGYGSLGTKTTGSITERLLPDGRAEVTVVLYTTNALTFASTNDTPSAETGTRLFGSSVQDLFRDRSRRPSLASSSLVMVFKNTKLGAPMPDLVYVFAFGISPPNFELDSLYFDVNATGSLPDGTPAQCRVLQHFVFPPPMLINGVLVKQPDLNSMLLDGGWLSEFVDIK